MTLKRQLASVLALLAFAGACGDSREALHPVSGVVTYQGQPAAGARVVLVSATPKEMKGKDAAIPAATADAQGKFRITSFVEGDGAPAGEYAVTVTWIEVLKPSNDPESQIERDRLKGKYVDPTTSGLKATVAPGDNQLPPIDLK